MFTVILTNDQMALIIKALRQEQKACQKLAMFLNGAEGDQWQGRADQVTQLLCNLEHGAPQTPAQQYGLFNV